MQISDANQLVEEYGRDIYSFCRKLTYSEFDAEELYQDTFLKAVDVIERIDENNNPKSFLLSIAVSLWNNKKRKYARRNRIAPAEHIESDRENELYKNNKTPESEFLKKELYEILNSVISQLDDKMRIPFLLYYNSGLSVDKISELIDCPKGTVKSRLFNARAYIKAKMEVYGIDR